MQAVPNIETVDVSGDLAGFYGAVTGLLGRVSQNWPEEFQSLNDAAGSVASWPSEAAE